MKRYNYYVNRVNDIKHKYALGDGEVIMYKEKFGRFDMTAATRNHNANEELEYLEEESEHRCMDCAKLRKQIWFREGGWLQHSCFRCYLTHLPHMFILWIRRMRYKYSKRKHD